MIFLLHAECFSRLCLQLEFLDHGVRICFSDYAVHPNSHAKIFLVGYIFIYLFLNFIYLFLAALGLLCRVRAFSLVAGSGGYSSLRCVDLLRWLLLLRGTGSRRKGFSSCGSRAQ